MSDLKCAARSWLKKQDATLRKVETVALPSRCKTGSMRQTPNAINSR